MASVESVQRELDELKASSLRASVEAEQALHEASAKVVDLERQLAASQSEAAARAAKEAEAQASKERLLNELHEARKGQDEGKVLKDEVKRVEHKSEAEKRELLLAWERAESDKKTVEASLAALRELHASVTASNSTLEASLQEATSTSRTALLRLQTSQSTVSSLEGDKEFLSTELEKTRAEWGTYRRTKQSELVALQSSLEQVEVEAQTSRAQLDALRTAHDALAARHQETVQELSTTRSELAASEANFGTEMAALKRLVGMLEKREEDRQRRVDELEASLEGERGNVAEREQALQQQLSAEQDRSEALSSEVADLKAALQSAARPLDDDLEIPGTPASHASFVLSPSAQLAARQQRGGRGYTEVYAEYVRIKDELAEEKKETKRLGECLEQILAEIQERAPLLKEQRLEYERLSIEATNLASDLASAVAAKDASQRRAEAHALDIQRLQEENTIASAQLRDLGRQLRMLMRVMAQREYPGVADRSAGQLEDEEEAEIARRVESSQDTDTIVSAHLVTFQTINDLQAQNQKLLRITRQMGLRLEKDEREYNATRAAEENAAVEEAHELILRLKEEVESLRVTVNARVKERDMYRRLLAQHDATQSESLSRLHRANGDDGESGNVSSRALVDLQASFDAYRDETAADSARLREDVTEAHRETGTLRTELAKAKAQAEFVQERFRLLTESYNMQATEIRQVSKRTAQLQETMAQQDAAASKLTGEVFELKSRNEQLKHENSNLKTEREVWKRVEDRLVEDNSTLSKERGQLAELLKNLQTMQNELERAGGDAKRRLETQVTRLEGDVSELKEKLSQETDSHRQLSLRKEMDGKVAQERLDKVTADYQAAREALVVAETSLSHTQTQVTHLEAAVSAKDQRLAVYEGRSGNGARAADPLLSREQQLEMELADLRAEVHRLKGEVEQARGHVEQYKAIAQSNEETLRSVSASHDEYKSTLDASLAAKDAELVNLKERLQVLTSELNTSNGEITDLHRRLDTDRESFEKEKRALEDSMVGLRGADETARESIRAAQEDLQRQSQIAREAHEKYERELVAHAEDVKRLSDSKTELETARAALRDQQGAADVAKANLLESTSSWERQRQTLNSEMADLQKRCDDLRAQNATLHSHLESVSAQAIQLQGRQPGAEDGQPPATGEGATEQLRDVIKYLRQEKDIVDLQLELSKQEAARLRQQLEVARRSLDESREQLAEERRRAGDTTTSSAHHAELLEKINTLNILRESNATLREETEQSLKKSSELQAQLNAALAEIDPLKQTVKALEAEIESKSHQIRLLEEDNNRWKVRNQQVLAKYERIDPEELQSLKDESAKLRERLAELEGIDATRQGVEEKLQAETQRADSMQQNWNQSRDRFTQLQVQARSLRSTRDSALSERDALTAQLAEATSKLEAASATAAATSGALPEDAIKELEGLRTSLQSARDEVAKVKADLSGLQSGLAERTAEVGKLTEEKAALEARLAATPAGDGNGPAASEDNQELASLREQLAAVTAEKAVFEEKANRLSARERPLFADNKRLMSEAKGHAETVERLEAEIKARDASRDEAVENAVRERLAGASPAALDGVPPAVNGGVNADELVKQAVEKAQAEMASAKDAAVKAALETARSQHAAEMEKKIAEAKAAAIAQATEEAKAAGGKGEPDPAAIEAAVAKRLAETTAKEGEVVEAAVRAKIAELKAQEEEAIKNAVDAALAAQQTTHQKEIADLRITHGKESSMKTQLLQKRLEKAQADVAALRQSVDGSKDAPDSPAPTAGAAKAASPKPSPPVTRQQGAAPGAGGKKPEISARGRGRGGAAAAAGGGGAGRGSLLSVKGSGAPGTPAAGRAPGNMLDRAMAGATGGKRARAADEPASPETTKKAKPSEE